MVIRACTPHILAAPLALAGSALGQPTVTSIEPPAGFTASRASAVSGDGAVVVGWCSRALGGTRAFRWTREGGTVLLDLPQYGTTSTAAAVSADGAAIVGQVQGAGGYQRAHLWRAGAVRDLGYPGVRPATLASGISADGLTVVGSASSEVDAPWPFFWTLAGGFEYPSVPPGVASAVARGISADGSVVAGSGTTAAGSAAYRWGRPGALVVLDAQSLALAVSADGSVVVGVAAGRAARWTAEGRTDLGVLPTHATSAANAVNADGSIIVGSSTPHSGNLHAVVWSGTQPPADLGGRLRELGADVGAWAFEVARGVSSDGRTIAGDGRLNGRVGAWVVSGLGAPCPADVDRSGFVDAADYAAFVSCYEGAACPPGASADFNGDGFSDFFDYADFVDAFERGC